MVASKSIEAAVAELMDIEAVKKLKAQYCYFVDEGKWDDLDDLWTEDAVCDYGFFGRYEGKSQIMGTFFRQLVASAATFSAHMVHNPIIDMGKDAASVIWYLTAQTTVKNQAVWVMGIYHDKYVKVNGAWKISSLKFDFKYYTPFEEGWAKTPMWVIPA